MAVRDLEAFLRQRAGVFDPGLDVSPGSPFDTQIIQPLVQRLGTDPFTIDLSTFLFERVNQAFPDLATSEGDAITDLLIKPLTLLWDPVVREIQRIKQSQSFQNASLLTTEEAEALGANIFSDRRPGQTARGPARISFSQPQNVSITPINFVTSKSGLHYFPTETQSIRAEEMLLNVADDGTYYFDINVIAEKAGVEYNVEPNSLVSVANVPSAVRVTNLRRFTLGEDDEDAEAYISRARGELTERSLVTLRGISAKLTKSFPEIRRLNTVGFNDPEMQRDILQGGGLGEILGAGVLGGVDDDGEGQAHSRRFVIPIAEGNFATLATAGEASGYVVTVFGAFDDGSLAKDLHVRRILPVALADTVSRVDFEEQVMVLSATANLRWALRRRTLTLSGIPGGIIFPQGPLGTITVEDDKVHIGGTTDVHVGGSAFDQSTLTLDDVADNSPELSGDDVTVVTSGPNRVFELAGYVLDTTYLVTDSVFELFKQAPVNGMTLELLNGINAGSYRVLSVTQASGSPIRILTDPQPATVSAIPVLWKLLGSIDVELTDPRETVVAGNDLSTVQGSEFVTTAGGTDFAALGVLQNFVLRILDGPSIGDYTVDSLPAPTQLKLTQAIGSTDSNLRYEVFRPNLAGAMEVPLVRISKVELLDASSQPVGTTVPYAKPVDIQSRAFQNPARGIKLDIRDARLGIVGLPVGVEATGTITVIAPVQLVDGETFVLDDGINSPITFEFDTNSAVTPGNVRVDIGGLSTAQQVRDVVIAAINAIGSSLRISATASSTTVVGLTNLVPGSAGNQTITDTVADPAFTHTGMSGGVDNVYGVLIGDTLTISFLGFEGMPATNVNVVFATNLPSRTQLITEISAAINSALLIPNGAVAVSTDRFGIRPLRAGAMIVGGTARNKLFSGVNEPHSSWDVRSDTVDEAGGWDSLDPALDLVSGLDVVQVLDGIQVGIYSGPYTLPSSSGLRILDAAASIAVSSSRFAPESGVHVQVGARSLGSVRCFFLEPTSIEFDQQSRFSIETEDGLLKYLPDPSLTVPRIPPLPETAKPIDGQATGGGTTFTSGSQDFVRSGIRPGDVLNIFYVPISGTIALPDPVVAVGLTFVYSIDGQPDRTLTFIRDDLSLATTELSRDGVVDQINAAVGRTVVSLDSNRLKFATDVSFVVRKTGTANSVILGQRLGLPLVPRYSYSQVDQSNDSPHIGAYRISAVTQTVLTLATALPSSGDFPSTVSDQRFTVDRLGVQRIATTQMATNTAEPDLFYFDVELVSEGAGDHYNIGSDLQLTASNYRSDGYYLTTDDSNLSFSPAERPRLILSPSILENGVSDSPANATQLSGHNLLVNYDRSQLTDDVNNFLTSEVERVINESPLGRHLIPHFVRFALRYTGGSTEDLVTQDLENYLNNVAPNEAAESSDIQKVVMNRGATSIENPIDLVAVVHYPDRTIYVTRSQNSLTTGRLSAFIPDVLDVKRSTA
jgi:hypothetical protein